MNLLLGEGQDADAALHFNPRLDETTVVLNSKDGGRWGREERGAGLPFQRGQPFDLLIIATEDGFKVRRAGPGSGVPAGRAGPRPAIPTLPPPWAPEVGALVRRLAGRGGDTFHRGQRAPECPASRPGIPKR